MRRLILILVGAGVLWVCWQVGKDDFASRSWKPVQGQVTFSKSTKQASGWEPVVRYRYTVDGKSYESANKKPRGGWGVDDNVGTANMVVMDYPKGSAVTVYYNPANPTEAALKVGLGIEDFIFAILGALLMAAGIFWKGSTPAQPGSANATSAS